MKGASRERARTIGTTLIILLLVSAVGLGALLAEAAFDAPSIGIPRDLLARLAAGALTRQELLFLALAGATILVPPLIVIALLLAIERWAGPRARGRKNHRLAWLVQAVFVTAAALITMIMATIGIIPDTHWLRPDPAAGPLLAIAQTLLLFLAAIAIADALRYWVHRAQHAIPLLWRFHAVHHGPGDLDVLHNFTHPVEKLVNLLLITVPTAFLVGADGTSLLLVAGFFAVQGQLLHMNVPLRYGRFAAIIADNRFHFVHHSRDPADFNRNFAGVLPVLDRLFGTYRAPTGERLPPTGLAEWQGRNRLADYLLARPAAASAGLNRVSGSPTPSSPP